MKKTYFLHLLAIIALSATSCSKDGTVGPTGSQGSTGATGAIGATGPKGDTGTANVAYSDWITPPAYVKTTVFSTTTFTYDITDPKITQDILDKGVVLVYGKLNGYNPTIWPTDQVSALPIVINYLQGTTPEIDTWLALPSLGKLQINMKNNNNVYGNISNAHSFRYIIIPGSVKIADIDHKTYNEVRSDLHMQD
jgi:hypothetical protein